MTAYRIVNTVTGFVLGIYRGDSEAAALDAMAVDAGYWDYAHAHTATQAELETLTGIGPVIAKAIIRFRLENGPFKEIAEIQSVAGIGPVTFEKIEPYITVGGARGG